ncbi:MAG: ion channel [Eubacteriales bacterium]|nr:ion channel [Eubacteriales bacterium]
MKLSKRQHAIYDILISALAVVTVILLVVDFYSGVHGWQLIAYRFVLAIFLIDYILRLKKAPDKKKFIRNNICDLIVLLPLQTMLGWLPILQYHNLYRLLCIPRLVAFLYRPIRKMKRFFDTNGFKYMVFITCIMVLVGGVLIHFAEGMSISDGIWWAFVTASTVGYGDISPQTFYGRVIAMFLMLVGIGLIGSLTSTLTSYFMRTSKIEKKNQTIRMIQEQLDRFDELSEEEVEDLCVILRALKNKQNP